MIVKKNKKEYNVLENSWWKTSFEKWEPDFFNLLDVYLNKEMVFVDIGSWIGPVTLYVSKIVKEIHSIEANPIIFKILKENISKNEDIILKTNLYNYCLWNENKQLIEMNAKNTAPWDTSTVSAFYEDTDTKGFVIGKSITWNTFIRNNEIDKIDFIKIDIEGAEKIVLPTMKNYLIENKPMIIISLHHNILNLNDYNNIFDCLNHYNHVYDFKNKKMMTWKNIPQDENIDLFLK